MDAISTINNTLTNTPLPLMIEKLGLSIANAQSALDRNSIDMLQELAKYPIRIKDKDYNLLSLGFVPTFYAFTEASIEASMDFSISEATSIEVGGKLSVETKVIAVSVNANYARKFEQSAQGSSRIAARLVALPAPEMFMSIVTNNSRDEKQLEDINISNSDIVLDVNPKTVQLNIIYTPDDALNKEVIWDLLDTNLPKIAELKENKYLQITATGNITISAQSKYNPRVKSKKTINITSNS